MGCAQINILGGGNASPPTVSFPGAYSGSDPGIKIGIYYPPITNYIIPGPRPFTCNGQQPTTQTTIRTTTPTSTSTSSSSSSRPTTPTSTSVQPTSTGTVPQWGQCGGIGYNGPTVCQSPYRCVKSNDYVSLALALLSRSNADWVFSLYSTLNVLLKLFAVFKVQTASFLAVGTVARYVDYLYNYVPITCESKCVLSAHNIANPSPPPKCLKAACAYLPHTRAEPESRATVLYGA